MEWYFKLNGAKIMGHPDIDIRKLEVVVTADDAERATAKLLATDIRGKRVRDMMQTYPVRKAKQDETD